MNFLHRWDITFHWISFQCNSLRFPDITSHCPIKLCYIITDCVYLYFVLLSELEHFGFLSQYFQPPWVLVITQRFSHKTDTITTKICCKNQKVKVITRMCCIIPRDIEGRIPIMPHLGSNTKSFYTIHTIVLFNKTKFTWPLNYGTLSSSCSLLSQKYIILIKYMTVIYSFAFIATLSFWTLTLHWMMIYKDDAERDTGNSGQDWV